MTMLRIRFLMSIGTISSYKP
eukprot:COSAG02_NODE_20920_length_809_cov_60.729577_1_plen_20_part_10